MTRNGQDYSWNPPHFDIYTDRKVVYVEPGSGPAEGGNIVSFYGTGFVNSTDLEIRFGAYEPGGVNFGMVNTSAPGLKTWAQPDLWDVEYISPIKIKTVNPYHGQTSRVDVVATLALQTRTPHHVCLTLFGP